MQNALRSRQWEILVAGSVRLLESAQEIRSHYMYIRQYDRVSNIRRIVYL